MNKYLESRREEAGEVLSGFLSELVQAYDYVHLSKSHLGGLPYLRNDEIFTDYLLSRSHLSLEKLVAEKRADDLAKHFLVTPSISTTLPAEFRMKTSKLEKVDAVRNLKSQALGMTLRKIWPSRFAIEGWSAKIPFQYDEYFFDQFEEAKLQEDALFYVFPCRNDITIVGVVALERYASLITGEVHAFSPGNEFVRIDIAGIFNIDRHWQYSEESEFFERVETWKRFIEAFIRLSPCSPLTT